MTVLHTEVAKELEGKGIAARILDRMAAYARENKLAVVPRCAYVNVQFRRHPEKYNDIWKKD
jgi:predicted GNAT family acetyltransferase